MTSLSNTTSLPYTSDTWLELPDEFETLLRMMKVGYLFLVIVGTTLNSWLLVSVLTSPTLRSLFRSQFICVLLINNLGISSINSVLTVISLHISSSLLPFYHCGLATAIIIFYYTSDLIDKWCMLIFVARYISILIGFQPIKYFSPRGMFIGRVIMLVGPIVLSYIVVPLTVSIDSFRNFGFMEYGCLLSYEPLKYIVLFGQAVPFFLTPVVLALLLYFHRRRKSGDATPMNSHSLLEDNAEIDDVRMYISLLLVSFVTNAPNVLYEQFNLYPRGAIQDEYQLLIELLVDMRAIFELPCFLFQDDIRKRVKTWRPWYKPGPNTDLTVRYNPMESNENNV